MINPEAEPPPGARTSLTHPLRVDWVDLSSVPDLASATGRLGMTFLPGKKDQGVAGLHWRDLVLDAERLQIDHGTTHFVLLVEDHELVATRVPDFVEVLQNHRIDVTRYPIEDQGVPRSVEATRDLTASIASWVRDGQRVVVACRGGLGRTGTIVALVLRNGGLDAEAAMALTRCTRKKTIENETQEAYVRTWIP